MAISLVSGGALAGAINNGGDVTLTFPGGIAQDDVVVLVGGHFARASTPIGPSTAGYTQRYLNTTTNPWFGVWTKVMGASPDATVVGQGSGNAADSTAYACHVLRGVHTDILDQTIAAANATSTNPDSPAVVTQTANAWVLSAAISIVNDGTITEPTNYVNKANANFNDTNAATIGIASREIASPASENPAAWTGWSSGAWWAVSVAIKAALETRTLSLAATETGSDSMASSMAVAVAGSMAATETGVDTFASTMTVPLSLSMAAVEVGVDTFAASMTVTDPGANLSLNAFEVGDDTFASTGTVTVTFSVGAVEDPDAFASSMTVAVAGSMAAVEVGADTFASTMTVPLSLSMAAVEVGVDTFAATVSAPATLSMAATETGVDAFASTLTVTATLSLAATEVGVDVLASTLTAPLSLSMAATEVGADTFASTVTVPLSLSMAATEVGEDTFFALLSEGAERTLVLDATEAGDTAAALVSVALTASLAVTEIGDDVASLVLTLPVTGSLVVSEVGDDTLAGGINVPVTASVPLVEEGADTMETLLFTVPRLHSRHAVNEL
jgi:hypothetical protein